MVWNYPYNNAPSPAIGKENKHVDAAWILECLKQAAENPALSSSFGMAVFDLDATLLDNRPRVLRILRDIVKDAGNDLPEEAWELVNRIHPATMQYRVKDTLRSIGISDVEHLEYFYKGWQQRFFTNKYVTYDVPHPGAAEFVQRVSDLKLRVIYLTGRDTLGMRKGTLTALNRYGFPLPENKSVELITKPTFSQDDWTFKRNAIDQLRGRGKVVAVFDNEPKMSNLMKQAFPDAFNVFLDTMHSPDYEPLDSDIVILKNFLVPS